MVNLSKLITQLSYNIIKHTSLLNLKIDDSLLIDRLVSLWSDVDAWCMSGWARWLLKSDEGRISLSDTMGSKLKVGNQENIFILLGKAVKFFIKVRPASDILLFIKKYMKNIECTEIQ